MKNKNTIVLALVALVLVASGIGYYILRNIQKNKDQSDAIQVINPTANLNIPQTGNSSPQKGIEEGGKAPALPVAVGVKAPDLNRPLTNSTNLPPEALKKVTDDIANTIKALKGDSNSLDSWLQIGLDWKSLGDYEGARLAWEFAGLVRPRNSISFINLGFLYSHYLQNNALADKNYLQALMNDPHNGGLYIQTADFYVDFMKDPAKAKSLIQKGIAANPNDTELKAAFKFY